MLLLREFVSANCSVNLSVSADAGDDHDDEQGPAAGPGPHASCWCGELTDTRGGGAPRALGALRSADCAGRFERDGPGRPGPRQPGTASRRGSPRPVRATDPRPRPDHVRRCQRHATSPSCSPSTRASRSAGSTPPPAPARRRAARARDGGGRRGTAAGATGCPRRACSIQADGSRHDWLEGRGPRLTLVGRDRRCDRAPHRGDLPRAGGHRGLSRHPARHRPPLRRSRSPVYRDRHSLFETPRTSARDPRGAARRHAHPDPARARARRARDHLDRCPQPAGQGPHRARLGHLPGPPRHRAPPRGGRRPRRRQRGCSPGSCRGSTGGSRSPPRTRRPPGGRCPPASGSSGSAALKYRRVVANDRTVRAGATILQLPPGPGRRGYAGQARRSPAPPRRPARRLGRRARAARDPGPADPVQLRALESARVEVGSAAPSAAYRSGTIPAPDHPWRSVPVNSRLDHRHD